MTSAREQSTIRWGATVVVVALALAYGVLPLVRRWREREDAIASARDQVARLQGLLLAGPVVGNPGTPALVIRGRTSDLAGSTLQTLVQELARSSRVSVNRLEVRPDSGDAGTLRATLSATTDIYGLADLLARLQGHVPVLGAEELSVVPNPVLRGSLLQLTVAVRAPWVEAP